MKDKTEIFSSESEALTVAGMLSESECLAAKDAVYECEKHLDLLRERFNNRQTKLG